eukprot:ANDGO_06620.mRNA.1 Inner centromere protein mis6
MSSAALSAHLSRIDALVQEIAAYSNDNGARYLEPRVAEMEVLAPQCGLDAEQIHTLLDIVSSPLLEIPRRIASKIMTHCALPRTFVRSSTVLSLAGRLSGLADIPKSSFQKNNLNIPVLQGSISHDFQGTCLKWICSVFDCLDDLDVFHQVYSVLFQFVEFETLRFPLFQLLFRLTRREDVVPHRVRRLVALHERFLHDGPIYALLSLYVQYDRHFSLPPRKGTPVINLLKPADRALRERVLGVNSLSKTAQNLPLTLAVQRIDDSTASTAPLAKRPKRMGSSDSSSFTLPSDASKIAVDELVSLSELSQFFERVALPLDVSSVLESHMLHHVLRVQPDPMFVKRLSCWLEFTLEDYCLSRDLSTPKARTDAVAIFDSVVSFSQKFQELPHQLEGFLMKLLASWNGHLFLDQICGLIALLKPAPYEDVYPEVLVPLHRKLFDLSSLSKAKVLNALYRMLRYWLTFDWSLLQRVSVKAAAATAAAAAADDSIDMSQAGPSLFSKLPSDVDYLRALYEFVHYCDRIHTLCAISDCDHPLVLSACLDFSEMLSKFHTKFNLPFVVRPSTTIVYHSFLSSNPYCVDRVCGLIAQYKHEFAALKKNATYPSNLSFPQGLEELENFNRFIRDFSYCLWKPIAFSSNIKNEETMLFNVPKGNLEQFSGIKDLNGCLSVALLPSLRGLCVMFAKEAMGLSTSEATAQVNSVLESRKFDYIDYLKEKGLHGLHDFLYTFVSELLKRAQKR